MKRRDIWKLCGTGYAPSVFAYDAANQLSASTTGSRTTGFQYDAAGRLLSQTTDGKAQTRTYGFLDKVLVLTKPDGTRIGFDYYPDGQLAAKAPLPSIAVLAKSGQASSKPGRTVGGLISSLMGANPAEEIPEPSPEQAALNRNLREELVWDGLALLFRNGATYAIEPHVSGGVPVAASQGIGSPATYYINDILGTTLAVVHPDRVEIVLMTAFGKPATAKPGLAVPASPETSSLPEQTPALPVKP